MEGQHQSDNNPAERHEPPAPLPVPEHGAPRGEETKAEGEKQAEPSQSQLDRDMVRWTRALAFFTAALVIAAALQFWAMRGQLREMRATREGGDKSFADQIAIMQAQAKAMQGQLTQMALNERPWLAVSDLSFQQVETFAVGAGIVVSASYKVTNIGHSPARRVFINTALFLPDVDVFDEQRARALCKKAPPADSPNERRYTYTILPGQTETIDGFYMEAATFNRRIGDDIEKRARDHGGVIDTTLILAGCVSYLEAPEDKWAKTGFAFEVGVWAEEVHYQRSVINHLLLPIPLKIGEKGALAVGGSSIRAIHFPVGNFAD